MTAVDEAQKQLEIRDERADRHRAGDDTLATLPDDQDHARDHQGRVDRLEAALETSEAQVSLREPARQRGDPVDRRAGPAEEAQHPDAGEMFLDRRREIRVRFARLSGSPRHPAAGGVREHHRQRGG